MMNNIISIDLDEYSIVPTPCTLTDAVEKYNVVLLGKRFELSTKEDVEEFKKEYLYKEDTLEDGIYEAATIGDSKLSLWYVKGGKFGVYKENEMSDVNQLVNPRKIADL